MTPTLGPIEYIDATYFGLFGALGYRSAGTGRARSRLKKGSLGTPIMAHAAYLDYGLNAHVLETPPSCNFVYIRGWLSSRFETVETVLLHWLVLQPKAYCDNRAAGSC